MNPRNQHFALVAIVLLVILSAGVAFAEEDQKPDRRSFFRLSDHDVLLPIISLEWGAPDRFSFTSRYIHELGEKFDDQEWFNSLSLSISPGWSGGRASLGYMLLWDPKSSQDFGIFSELRATYLRTWGEPMYAPLTDENYLGAEFSLGLSFLLKVSGGYYWLLSPVDGHDDSFVGFHVGVGI